MAMKGKAPHEEIGQLDDSLTFHVEPLRVPELRADRCIVWIEARSEASARS
jgi:16S rRNA (guanine527-N7)-methyltransferase